MTLIPKKALRMYALSFATIGSKTTDEWGDEWRRLHTTGDEYI